MLAFLPLYLKWNLAYCWSHNHNLLHEITEANQRWQSSTGSANGTCHLRQEEGNNCSHGSRACMRVCGERVCIITCGEERSAVRVFREVSVTGASCTRWTGCLRLLSLACVHFQRILMIFICMILSLLSRGSIELPFLTLNQYGFCPSQLVGFSPYSASLCRQVNIRVWSTT